MTEEEDVFQYLSNLDRDGFIALYKSIGIGGPEPPGGKMFEDWRRNQIVRLPKIKTGNSQIYPNLLRYANIPTDDVRQMRYMSQQAKGSTDAADAAKSANTIAIWALGISIATALFVAYAGLYSGIFANRPTSQNERTAIQTPPPLAPTSQPTVQEKGASPERPAPSNATSQRSAVNP